VTADAKSADQLEIEGLIDFAFDQVAPATEEKVSEWAAAYRELDSLSAEGGKWRNERTPFLVEPMDCLSPSNPADAVVFMKGAQIGGTEAGNNWIGFMIDCAPGPMLVVHPNDDMAKFWSRTRLQPLIDKTPRLSGLVRDQRAAGGGNAIETKLFPGGVVKVASARSAASLRQMPARYLFLDDLDAFPPTAGNEGDPVTLAEGRTRTFRRNRKRFYVSTPNDRRTSRIRRLYLVSDQCRFEVPCPHCGTFQVLHFGGIKWPEGRPEEARYQCAACAALLEEHDKHSMLAGGNWEPASEDERRRDLNGKPVAWDGQTRGFHLPSFYSPAGLGLTWADIAVAWSKAKRSGDPEEMKVIVCTMFAEPWDDRDGDGFEAVDLAERCEPFPKQLEERVCLLTAGIDLQDDRIELEVVGWAPGFESWSLLYLVLPGNPSHARVWGDLSKVLRRRWSHPLADQGLPIACAAMDTAGHKTIEAYDYVTSRQRIKGTRVWGIVGRGGEGRKPWPRRPSRRNKGKIDLFTVGVDGLKEGTYSKLEILEPGRGFCHFPLGRDLDYFDQLTSESRVLDYVRGQPVFRWVKPDGARNEALDNRVYATAAVYGWMQLRATTLERMLDRLGGAPDDPTRSTKASTRPSRHLNRRRHWLKTRE